MKKIISILLCMLFIFLNAIVYANPKEVSISEKAVNSIIIQLNPESTPILKNPDELILSTTKNTITISGSGKKDEIATIELYLKDKKGNYIKNGEAMEIMLGALGVFNTDISLNFDANLADKEAKDYFMHIRIKRADKIIEDARLIKYSPKVLVKKSLEKITQP